MLKSLFNRLISKKEIQILVIGPYLAGKRTVLDNITHGLGAKASTTTPTTGPALPTLRYKNICFAALDVKLQDEISSKWPEFFQNTQGLVFVVDGTDKDHLNEVKDELHKLLNKDELSHAAVLVFINKNDLPNSMAEKEVVNNLGLPGWKKNHWHSVRTCAKTGYGFESGFDWLTNDIVDKMLDSASLVEIDMEFTKEGSAGTSTIWGMVDAVKSVNRLFGELDNAWRDVDAQRENLLNIDLEEGSLNNNDPTKEAQERAALGSIEWLEKVKGVRNAALDHVALTNEQFNSLKSSLGRLA